MMHPFRDKKQAVRRRRIVNNSIIFAGFLILAATGAVFYFGGSLNMIGWPIWKAKNAATSAVARAGSVIRTKSSVFNENENLLKENADLKNSMLDYNILKSENDQLKGLLGRIPATSSFILGTILVKPNFSPYDTIIIDAGLEDGVMEGQQVFASVDAPIGTVSKTYNKTSLVELYSNPGQSTEGFIEGSNASVELLGRGGGNFEMTIPVDLEVAKGAMVLLPNMKSEILAIVEDTISSPNDPVKKVILRAPINVQSLKWVEVKKN